MPWQPLRRGAFRALAVRFFDFIPTLHKIASRFAVLSARLTNPTSHILLILNPYSSAYDAILTAPTPAERVAAAKTALKQVVVEGGIAGA